jgi:phosphotriesterase-related protein
MVETTLGALPVEQLGRVDAHEHVIIEGGYTVLKEPEFRLDSVEKAIEEVSRWRAVGGGAIVDTMPFGCGRNVEKLIAVSQATGAPIIAPTGFQKSVYYLPDHWQHRYDEDTIAELLHAELTTGMDCNNYDGPVIRRTSVKAGFIKIAGEYQYVNATTRKLIRAAGKAHQATGAPILAHTELGTAGDILLDLLEEAGVAPNRVMLCHMDYNHDFYVHRQLTRRGAFLEYDSMVRVKNQPQHIAIQLMRQLFDAGFGDRILLGGDMARRSYWRAYGGGPGFDYLLTNFSQRLRDERFSEAELDMIWRENPARWLAG